VLPGAFNALCGLMLKEIGFSAIYVSGAGVHNSAGKPDTGLLSLEIMSNEAKKIIDATKLPAICDVDTGLGNISKTVKRYESIGAWGIQVEDQKLPKKCGHLDHKHLISTGAMVNKIKAAVKARKDKDFLIIARTDANNEEGIEGAIARANAYLSAGADVIFPEALRSKREFKRFAKEVNGLLFANMTEFGKTPYITVREFEKMGYSMVIFPLSAMRLMMKAVADGMKVIYNKGTQKKLRKKMQTRNQLYSLLNYKP